MQIRHLGTLDAYLEDTFVQSCIPEVTALIDRRLGVLPVIAVIEALRIDPDLDVSALVAAVLQGAGRGKDLRPPPGCNDGKCPADPLRRACD